MTISRPLAAAGLLLSASACRPAIQAPDDLEALVVFAFVHFEDPELIAAILPDLFAQVEAHGDDLDVGVAVDRLTADDLTAIGVPDAEIDGIYGALGAARYDSGLDDVARALTLPDRAQVYEATTAYTVEQTVGDRDAFLSRDQRVLHQTVRDESQAAFIGRTARTLTHRFRWLMPPDGADEVLAIRQAVPDPLEVGNRLVRIDQQYNLVFLRPDEDGGTRRAEAIWVDATLLGLELPEGWAVRTAVDRMQSAATELDAWVTDGG